MKVYLVCPVRNSSEEQRRHAQDYVSQLEKQGIVVHFPPRDSDQREDGIGLRVNESNRSAILSSDESHVIWDSTSYGSHFDLGMVFMLRAMRNVPIKLVNEPQRTEGKSYSNILLELAN